RTDVGRYTDQVKGFLLVSHWHFQLFRARHRKRHTCSSPTTPFRKAMTHSTKIAPMITVTHAPTLSASIFCRVITIPAPSTGPKKVPTPPSRLIRITSPDIDQCT